LFQVRSGVALVGGSVYFGARAAGVHENLCLTAITEKSGLAFNILTNTDYRQTPGGAIDIRGSFDGDTFACALQVTRSRSSRRCLF
jgi:hypothetical protein